MPTICATCINVLVPEGSKARWWAWTCLAHRWEPIFNPVTGDNNTYPPHRYCKTINDGNCDDYQIAPNILKQQKAQEQST